MSDLQPNVNASGATIKPYTVAATKTVTKFMPVVLSGAATTIADAASGEAALGVALKDGVAGDVIPVALLCSNVPLPFKVGTAGCAFGDQLVMGTTGAIGKTLGGGTVVAHVIGTALETGVSGDIRAFMPNRYDGVSA
jgi:hypothetical protein